MTPQDHCVSVLGCMWGHHILTLTMPDDQRQCQSHICPRFPPGLPAPPLYSVDTIRAVKTHDLNIQQIQQHRLLLLVEATIQQVWATLPSHNRLPGSSAPPFRGARAGNKTPDLGSRLGSSPWPLDPAMRERACGWKAVQTGQRHAWAGIRGPQRTEPQRVGGCGTRQSSFCDKGGWPPGALPSPWTAALKELPEPSGRTPDPRSLLHWGGPRAEMS